MQKCKYPEKIVLYRNNPTWVHYFTHKQCDHKLIALHFANFKLQIPPALSTPYSLSLLCTFGSLFQFLDYSFSDSHCSYLLVKPPTNQLLPALSQTSQKVRSQPVNLSNIELLISHTFSSGGGREQQANWTINYNHRTSGRHNMRPNEC